MSWSKRKKLVTVFSGVSTTTLLLTSFFVLSTTKNNNDINVVNNNLKTINKENKLENSLLDFPIHILKKSSSPYAKNVLVVSDAFSSQDINRFIPYAKQFSYKYFDQYPSIQFSELFNIYAVSVESKHSGTLDFNIQNKDTYFQTFFKGDRSVLLTEKGQNRLDAIRKQFDDRFLDFPNTERRLDATSVLWNTHGYGGTAQPQFKMFASTLDSGWSTWSHEISHVFGLGDEYGADSPYMGSPNQSRTGDIETIKWKTFLGYDGVTAINRRKYWVPKSFCKMNNSSSDYCPVCEWSIFKYMQSYVPKEQKMNYYSEPVITQKIEENLAGYNSNKQPFANYEIWQDDASEQVIDLRTMVENYSAKTLNLKLVLRFTNNLNPAENQEWEETFSVGPKELKQLKLTTDVALPKIDMQHKEEYDLVGELIDTDTNTIIKKSAKYKQPKEEILNREQIDVDFLDENDQPISIINQDMYASSSLDVKDYSDIGDIQIPGYQLIKKDVDTEKKKITFKYRLKKSKTLDLLLVSDLNKDNPIVKRKTIELFEDETFIPTENDYWYDGAKIVPYNKTPIKYNDIEDNHPIYYALNIQSYNLVVKQKNITLKKGEDFDFVDNAEIRYTLDYKEYVSNIKPEIQFNGFNNQVPGTYSIKYYFGDGYMEWASVRVLETPIDDIDANDKALVQKEINKLKTNPVKPNNIGLDTYLKLVTEENISTLVDNWPKPENDVVMSIEGFAKNFENNILSITLKFKRNNYSEYYTFYIDNFKNEVLPPKFNINERSVLQNKDRSYEIDVSGKYLQNIEKEKLKVWTEGEFIDYTFSTFSNDFIKLKFFDTKSSFVAKQLVYMVYDNKMVGKYDIWPDTSLTPPGDNQNQKDVDNYVSNLKPITLNESGKQLTLAQINQDNISRYVDNWPTPPSGINMNINYFAANIEQNKLTITLEFSKGDYKKSHDVIITGFKIPEIGVPSFNHDINQPILQDSVNNKRFTIKGNNLDKVEIKDLIVKHNTNVVQYDLISQSSKMIIIELIGDFINQRIKEYQLDCFYKDNKIATLSFKQETNITPPTIEQIDKKNSIPGWICPVIVLSISALAVLATFLGIKLSKKDKDTLEEEK